MKNEISYLPDPTLKTHPTTAFTDSSPLMHQALRQLLLELVVLVFEVDPEQLMGASRGRKQTAFARQVAMYLAHIAGGLTLGDVGRLFGRDRTTVAHACALVEDARDDRVMDRTLTHLESAISCQKHFSQLQKSGSD